MGVLSDALNKLQTFSTPQVPSRGSEICLGILNCFFFGVGTIIGGFMSNDLADVLIGVGQLFIPFVGWIWSIVWGVLMITGKNSPTVS